MKRNVRLDIATTAVMTVVSPALAKLRDAGNVATPTDDIARDAIRGCINSNTGQSQVEIAAHRVNKFIFVVVGGIQSLTICIVAIPVIRSTSIYISTQKIIRIVGRDAII